MNLKLSTCVALFVAIAAVGFLTPKAHAVRIAAAIAPSEHLCAFPVGPDCQYLAETVNVHSVIQVVESPNGHIEASCTGQILFQGSPVQAASACDSHTFTETSVSNQCLVKDPSDSDIESVGTWHATMAPNGQFSLTCEGQDTKQ